MSVDQRPCRLLILVGQFSLVESQVKRNQVSVSYGYDKSQPIELIESRLRDHRDVRARSNFRTTSPSEGIKFGSLN
jgi:hypothetical protein